MRPLYLEALFFLRMFILDVVFILCEGTSIFVIVFYECIDIKKIVSIISMERRKNMKLILSILLYSELISRMICIQVDDFKEINEGKSYD